MARAAIFLNNCLPLSEVFVLHQALSLDAYQPQIVACKRVQPSVPTGLPETVLNEHGTPLERIRELAFKATRRSRFLKKALVDSDVIHAHFGPSGWLVERLARQLRKPLVVTLHGFDVLKNDISRKTDGPLQTTYYNNRAILAESASVFLCVSEYIRKRAIEFGFPEEKCHVHYMGIPLQKHMSPKHARDGKGPVRLLAAGRLVPFKAHEKLIEAVAKVQSAGYDVHLSIAGDGPLRPDLEAQAAASLKNYTFHGALDHTSILQLMRNSDIFCHTSMHMENGQTEAFGLVVLEAQWAGLPVVAFESGGVPEALAPGQTGLLCPEGDTDAFAANIRFLIEDHQRLATMATAAPEFVQQNFDNQKQGRLLEGFYDLARSGFAGKQIGSL